MIRQFIRDTIRDLTNAVARSELVSENARLRDELAAKNSTIAGMRADAKARPKVIADIAEAVGAPEGRLSLAPDVVAWARKQKAEIERLSAPCPADGMDDERLGMFLWAAYENANMHRDAKRALGAKARALFGRPAR